MELDFSHPPTPQPAKVIVSRTPPSGGWMQRVRPRTRDEESAGYVEMRPGALGLSPRPPAPDGYVEMSLGSRTPLRAAAVTSPGAPRVPSPPEPAPEPEPEPELEPEPEPEPEPECAPEPDHHPLATLREISEECARKSPELSSSPAYVALARPAGRAEPPGAGLKVGAPRAGLHYAALDLEPRAVGAPAAPRTYTQIDFLRSEKLAADN